MEVFLCSELRAKSRFDLAALATPVSKGKDHGSIRFGVSALLSVPVGSPSRGGDAVVHVFDIYTIRACPLLFILLLCLFFVFKALQLYFIP